MRKFLLLITIIIFGSFLLLNAQQDTIVFKNNDVIVGEIKEMDRGVLVMKTTYSESDFKIEWSGVSQIFTETLFFITTTTGERYNGKLKSKIENMVSPGPLIEIVSIYGVRITVHKDDIVLLKPLSQDIWSRLYASIDFGYSLTKANNLHQLSIGSSMNYIANTWSSSLTFNGMSSTQNKVEPIRRWDGDFTYRFFLPKDWYLFSQISFLSNTEQRLTLRTMGKLGSGNFVIHTNKSYWGLLGGMSFNNEKYTTEMTTHQSLEGFAGTELNLYDIGDLNLLVNLTLYPSFTDWGRWRSDFNFETKYDLPLDFYIKITFTLNYDNRPVEGGNSADYIITTGFGWEFDN